jgi:hypothetical protein
MKTEIKFGCRHKKKMRLDKKKQSILVILKVVDVATLSENGEIVLFSVEFASKYNIHLRCWQFGFTHRESYNNWLILIKKDNCNHSNCYFNHNLHSYNFICKISAIITGNYVL